MCDCDCSEEYGPCEDHSILLVQRDGSAVRTADELSQVFIGDAVVLGVQMSRTAELDLEALNWAGSWLANPDDVETLIHYRDQIESDLYSLSMAEIATKCDRETARALVDAPADSFLSVEWDDGYRISVCVGGPLFDRQ